MSDAPPPTTPGSAPPTAGRRPAPRAAAWLRPLLLVAIVAAAYVALRTVAPAELRDPRATAEAVRALRGRDGIAALFVAVYAAAAALGLPATLLTLAGGALFGTALGTLLNWTGATIGATLGHLLARALGRDAVRALLGRRADALDRAVHGLGFVNLLRLRLIPLVPFNVLNFAAGLAGVPLRPYVLATALGIIPGAAAYTFFADALLAGAEGAREDALVRVAIAGGVLVLLSFVPTIARKIGWIAPAAALALGATTALGVGSPTAPASAPGTPGDAVHAPASRDASAAWRASASPLPR